MKPDALRLQLQIVLITYYEDIKGVVSASSCTKPKVVKRKFVDQDAANTAAAITADAATPTLMPIPPPPRRTRARRRGTRTRRGGASTGPQLWGQEQERQGAGFKKRCWQGLRLIPIKLV